MSLMCMLCFWCYHRYLHHLLRLASFIQIFNKWLWRKMSLRYQINVQLFCSRHITHPCHSLPCFVHTNLLEMALEKNVLVTPDPCITLLLKTYYISLPFTPLHTRVLIQSGHTRSLYHKQPSLYHLYVIFHRQTFYEAIFSSLSFSALTHTLAIYSPASILQVLAHSHALPKAARPYPSSLFIQ